MGRGGLFTKSAEELSPPHPRGLCKLGIVAHFCLSHRVRNVAEGKNGGWERKNKTSIYQCLGKFSACC